MSRKFDRFMVDVNIASNPKLATLTPAERWCAVAGVFALAALSPVRGSLLIGEHRADEHYVAHHARVTVAVARSAMRKMRAVGMIVEDAELDCEAVHDFDQWNPSPKSDPTGAERQQRYRDRRSASRNGRHAVTPVTVTTPEVEGEVEEKKDPPNPPISGGTFPVAPKGGRDRDRASYEQEAQQFAATHFPGVQWKLVQHHASLLRLRRNEPTVEALRPLIEEMVA